MNYMLIALALVFLTSMGCASQEWGDCSLSYSETGVIVPAPSNETHAIQIVKDYVLSNDALVGEFNYDVRDETYWDRARAEYLTNRTYAGDKLKEGWYVDILHYHGGCCLTFCITPSGHLFETHKRAC